MTKQPLLRSMANCHSYQECCHLCKTAKRQKDDFDVYTFETLTRHFNTALCQNVRGDSAILGVMSFVAKRRDKIWLMLIFEMEN